MSDKEKAHYKCKPPFKHPTTIGLSALGVLHFAFDV
jgi:hypothetical protein